MVPVNRINNIWQFSTKTRNRELTTFTQTITEFETKELIEFIGLNSHAIPTSTEIKKRNFLSPFVVIIFQFTSTAEPPFDHQWGILTFYNPISGLKDKTTF